MTTVHTGNTLSDTVAALNAQARESAGAAASANDEVQNRFLQLLVTQLKNQDPLNPLDNAAVTTQISQINTVTGIERLNATLETLLASYNDGQAMQAAALIGKNVLVAGSSLTLVDGEATGGAYLSGPADSVTVSIVDAGGRTVQKQDLGAREAGSFSFSWDGKTDGGALAPPGSYQFTVNAVSGGEKVGADTLQVGTVSAVVRGKSGFELELGGVDRVGFDKVQQVL